MLPGLDMTRFGDFQDTNSAGKPLATRPNGVGQEPLSRRCTATARLRRLAFVPLCLLALLLTTPWATAAHTSAAAPPSQSTETLTARVIDIGTPGTGSDASSVAGNVVVGTTNVADGLHPFAYDLGAPLLDMTAVNVRSRGWPMRRRMGALALALTASILVPERGPFLPRRRELLRQRGLRLGPHVRPGRQRHARGWFGGDQASREQRARS